MSTLATPTTAPATAPRPPAPRSAGQVAARHALGRIGWYVFVGFLLVFFALPLLWMLTTPFDATPSLRTSLPTFTLANFRALLDNPYALGLAGQLGAAGGGVARHLPAQGAGGPHMGEPDPLQHVDDLADG